LQAVGQLAHRHIAMGLQFEEFENALGLPPEVFSLTPGSWQVQRLLNETAAQVP